MTLFVDIDILGSRFLGKSRHSHVSPVIGMTKPAPAAISIWRTVTTKSFGRPSNLGLSDSDFCVLAIQTGSLSNPRAMIFFKSFWLVLYNR